MRCVHLKCCLLQLREIVQSSQAGPINSWSMIFPLRCRGTVCLGNEMICRLSKWFVMFFDRHRLPWALFSSSLWFILMIPWLMQMPPFFSLYRMPNSESVSDPSLTNKRHLHTCSVCPLYPSFSRCYYHIFQSVIAGICHHQVFMKV